MFDKIFGKKNSILRSIMKYFMVGTLIVVIILSIAFYIVIRASIKSQIIDLHLPEQLATTRILEIYRRVLLIGIIDIICTEIYLIRVFTMKMLKPIEDLNKATKKVSNGDFDIELHSERKDEIGELTDNFNNMVIELKSTDKLQNDFINNVSHEIKTPISSIQGFAKLLEDDSLTQDERKEYVDIIKEESDRLLKISTNILRLSKLQNQERLDNVRVVDLTENIQKAVNIVKVKAQDKNIIIKTKLDKNVKFKCDR